MATVTPDQDALQSTVQLLTEPPEQPTVRDGFLDLLESTTDTGVGRIQSLWQNTFGSGLYDNLIRFSTQIERRLPTVGGRQTRQFFGVPQRLHLTGAETVLDLGCGPGNLTRRVAAGLDSGLLVGLDVSTAMLRRAVDTGNPRRVVYVRADANRPPFADGVFDAVYSSMCLQLLPDPLGALDEIYRMLRPGGRLAVTLPGAGSGDWVSKRVFGLVETIGQVRLFKYGELAEALRQRGFSEVVDNSTLTTQFVDARKPL